MQFHSSRIRLLISNLNIWISSASDVLRIYRHYCIQYNWNENQNSQWTARFNIQRKPEKCWRLLRNLSFRLFDHKKIPGIFQDFPKISAEFQDFPGLSKTLFQIPELSRTFQDWWEPWELCSTYSLGTFLVNFIVVGFGSGLSFWTINSFFDNIFSSPGFFCLSAMAVKKWR